MEDKSSDRWSEIWGQAEANPGKEIDIGRTVLCDSCGEDYTDSQRCGGFIFQSRAICPQCAADWMASIIANSEQRMIRAACQEGQSFADFVREYRGPNNTVSIGPLRRDVE